MEERLLKLLDTEQLSPSKFADIIGVQRSSVSHILSGRNKPSFDFMQKTLKAFPLLNADWLIIGEGDMYDDMRNYVSGGLFGQTERVTADQSADTPETPVNPNENHAIIDQNAADILKKSGQQATTAHSEAPLAEADSIGKLKKITRVILFYDDNSFHTYDPES